MKKTLTLLTLVLAVFTLTACGEKKEKNIKGSLADLMKEVYEGVDIEGLNQEKVPEDKMEYMLGSSDLDIKEAYYSEPLISSVAHSVVLARANEDADIAAIKKEIKEKVNPRKWVCVWVDEEHVHVESRGDLIILIMDNKNDEKLLENFNNL